MRKKNTAYYSIIKSFIVKYTEENGVSPTVSEIAEHTGICRATTGRYLKDMREHGTINYTGHRSIILSDPTETREAIIKVPLLGTVSCGELKFAEGSVEEYIPLPVALFGKDDYFMLRANGDSMVEADIRDGDIVLIRRQNYADPGQIVVALTEEEATLKRFYPEPEKNRVRLHQENKAMKDIFVENCVIQGVAVKVFKDIQ